MGCLRPGYVRVMNTSRLWICWLSVSIFLISQHVLSNNPSVDVLSFVFLYFDRQGYHLVMSFHQKSPAFLRSLTCCFFFFFSRFIVKICGVVPIPSIGWCGWRVRHLRLQMFNPPLVRTKWLRSLLWLVVTFFFMEQSYSTWATNPVPWRALQRLELSMKVCCPKSCPGTWWYLLTGYGLWGSTKHVSPPVIHFFLGGGLLSGAFKSGWKLVVSKSCVLILIDNLTIFFQAFFLSCSWRFVTRRSTTFHVANRVTRSLERYYVGTYIYNELGDWWGTTSLRKGNDFCLFLVLDRSLEEGFQLPMETLW